MSKEQASGNNPESSKKTLRERAEEFFKVPPTDFSSIPPAELQALVYELQIHQVELEMQNEELREAQVELAHSRDRFADLYDFAPVGFATFDQQGLIREANLTAAAMLGTERARLLGHKFSESITEDSQGEWHIHCREVLAGEGTKICELQLKPIGEQSLTVQLHSRLAPDKDRQVLHFHSAIADVTERKFSRDLLEKLNLGLEQSLSDRAGELQRSVERVALLSEAISHLNEGIVITEGGLTWPGPTIIFVNDALCQITGYRADELIGQTPRILQGENTDAKTLRLLRRELSSNRSHRCELVNYRKDGSRYHAEIWLSPIPTAPGEDPKFIAIHRDISERKVAEKALRSLYEFSESLIDTAQHFILVLDHQGRVVRFNPAFEDRFGWSLAEAEGADWFDTFLPERDRKRIRERFAKAIGGNQTRGEVNAVVTRQGEERLIEWHDAVLRDPEGKFTGLLCSGTDVTNRLRLEQEVINAIEEQQQRIARDLHDDLGSLLTSVGLRANTLTNQLSKLGNEKLASDSETIKQQLQAAVAKTRAISKGLHPMGGPPSDLVGSLEELAARARSDSPMRCQFHCPTPVVVGDPIVANHLFRIAQESVNNAVKYSGGSAIAISLQATGDQILLEITDDGDGFDRLEDEPAGLGLHIMNYRASAIGAELTIGRGETGGTRVACSRSNR